MDFLQESKKSIFSPTHSLHSIHVVQVSNKNKNSTPRNYRKYKQRYRPRKSFSFVSLHFCCLLTWCLVSPHIKVIWHFNPVRQGDIAHFPSHLYPKISCQFNCIKYVLAHFIHHVQNLEKIIRLKALASIKVSFWQFQVQNYSNVNGVGNIPIDHAYYRYHQFIKSTQVLHCQEIQAINSCRQSTKQSWN